jgi:N-acetyl-alpha-D-muramate 1-phosphate uridylyltransferase
MKAMILAAGLGTRLKPLTDAKPKALIDVGGYTMLELSIKYLKKFGIREIIINVHHFADQIIQYLEARNFFDLKIEFSDERSSLLETGGAIKHASWYLKNNEPFVLMAGDVLTDLDLLSMLSFHKIKKPLVTLAVKNRETSRSLIFDMQMKLVGWKNNQTGETKGQYAGDENYAMGFSGIHIIEPDIFDLIVENGAFPIVDLYLRLMDSQPILGFRHDDSKWIEFGRTERLQQIIDSEEFRYLTKTL